MKESGNIRNSWTKAIEKTVRKFCTTASRIKKDAVRSVKAANIAIGISAITIGKMKLEQLKKKLPNINISIDYTGTWKDSLQLGLGIVTTGGGLLLTLAGGVLASLYNAPTTMQLSYQNQTNHDLAHSSQRR